MKVFRSQDASLESSKDFCTDSRFPLRPSCKLLGIHALKTQYPLKIFESPENITRIQQHVYSYAMVKHLDAKINENHRTSMENVENR